MKKEIGLLFILLLFSCANNFNKEAMIEDESYDIAGYEIEIEPENVTLEQLASKKLQAYFELLKLKTEHPEFREDILAQLKDFIESFCQRRSYHSFRLSTKH